MRPIPIEGMPAGSRNPWRNMTGNDRDRRSFGQTHPDHGWCAGPWPGLRGGRPWGRRPFGDCRYPGGRGAGCGVGTPGNQILDVGPCRSEFGDPLHGRRHIGAGRTGRFGQLRGRRDGNRRTVDDRHRHRNMGPRHDRQCSRNLADEPCRGAPSGSGGRRQNRQHRVGHGALGRAGPHALCGRRRARSSR